MKTFESDFSYIEVLFTDQNSKPLEIEDKIKITLVINLSVTYKNNALFNLTKRINFFLSFAVNMRKNIGKNLSGKYGQKLHDHAKQYTVLEFHTTQESRRDFIFRCK